VWGHGIKPLVMVILLDVVVEIQDVHGIGDEMLYLIIMLVQLLEVFEYEISGIVQQVLLGLFNMEVTIMQYILVVMPIKEFQDMIVFIQ
jgi:hypothetical protein